MTGIFYSFNKKISQKLTRLQIGLFKNPRVNHENLISLKNPHKLLSVKPHYLPHPPTSSYMLPLPFHLLLEIEIPPCFSFFPNKTLFSPSPLSLYYPEPSVLSVPFLLLLLLLLLLHLSTPFPGRDKMNFISVES